MLRRIFLVLVFAAWPIYAAPSDESEVETLADLQKLTDDFFWGSGYNWCGEKSEKLCEAAKGFFNGHPLEETWKKMNCSQCADSNAFCGRPYCKTWRTTLSRRVACAYFGLCGSHQTYDPDERHRIEREERAVGVIFVTLMVGGLTAVSVMLGREIYRSIYPAKTATAGKRVIHF